MRGEDREHLRPKVAEPGARESEGQPPDSGSAPLPPAGDAPTAQIPTASVPLRRCPRCSAESRTADEVCPHCGARFVGRRRIRAARPTRVIALVLVGLLVAAGAVAAFLAIQRANQRAAAEKRQTQVRAQRQAAARREKIARRRQLVRKLELSVAKKAATDVASGVMAGPVRRTVCTPLGATNPNDPTQHTGSFECIAVTKDNPNGSYEGYRFSAIVSYDAGSYTSRLAG
jgi:hypothetical protein